eukprot:363785-Chlamydomonas_euryale.AAC.5
MVNGGRPLRVSVAKAADYGEQWRVKKSSSGGGAAGCSVLASLEGRWKLRAPAQSCAALQRQRSAPRCRGGGNHGERQNVGLACRAWGDGWPVQLLSSRCCNCVCKQDGRLAESTGIAHGTEAPYMHPSCQSQSYMERTRLGMRVKRRKQSRTTCNGSACL